MTGGSLLRRAKKVINRSGSTRESSRASESYSTPVQPDSEEHDSSGLQDSHQNSLHTQEQPTAQQNDGIWLIDEQGAPIRRRGRTTCADIQSMPPGTRVHIDVNEKGIPNNFSESILLGSYLGVIASDPVLAPISFPDWRNKGMEQFKRKILAEVEKRRRRCRRTGGARRRRRWGCQALGIFLEGTAYLPPSPGSNKRSHPLRQSWKIWIQLSRLLLHVMIFYSL